MLSWCDESGQSVERSYDAEGLDELRGQAREQRGGAADGKSGIRAELFRTLGQELDREGAQLGWLNQAGNGVQVRALVGSEQIVHYYAHDELEELSRQRQAIRQPPEPQHPHRPLWFFGRHPPA